MRYTKQSVKPRFDLSIDTKLRPRLVLRSGFNTNYGILNTSNDAGSIGREEHQILGNLHEHNETFIKRAGFRIALKHYPWSKDQRMPKGFFHGPVIDLQRAERRVVKSSGPSQSEQTVYYDKVEGRGYFFGGGYCAGYTFKLGRLMIEPAFTCGLGEATGNVLVPPDPNAFVDLSNIMNAWIRWNPTRLELHMGWDLTPTEKKTRRSESWD